MEILDYFYNLRPKNNIYKDRKLTLPSSGSYILFGARGCGKSTLLIEHLNLQIGSNWLYIDCQDPIFALEDIDAHTMQQFLSKEKITILALDHYYDGFLDALPDIDNLILVTSEQTSINLPKLNLYPLDYEEFLGFQKYTSASSSFNHFLKVGTLPAVASAKIDSSSLMLRTQFYASFDEDESRLMLILAKHQGHKVTTHQLYTYAKEYFRISKDWVYKTIKRFKDEGLILFIEDITTKGAQKMILYDFALSKYLSKSQPFHVTFDAIVTLALFKHDIKFRALGIHGYLVKDQQLLIPAAFENEESFWKKAYKKIHIYKKYKIIKVTIVSVSNSYRFSLNDIEFESIPFYEWSILNE